ncbi:hypothetical protein GOP47_0020136 [Adiantum capillus-veneris]|uniref:snRNA-activating protein complex subunit 3 n=1 Tax=Adiantum capillus-veneris TaxID=13818 RepID=A0A9D4ZAB4_ADICA|nr:hypothetical protein GOP47_0020136 [Adiantum capillus-veneris]
MHSMEHAIPAQVMEVAKPPSSSDVAADEPSITGAPGGPLFMRGFVSPRICVRNFQASCATILMAIQAELNDPSIQSADDADLLVEDLKIVSEEQLISHGLDKIVEEEASEVVECTSDNAEQNNSPSTPMPYPDQLENASVDKPKNRSHKKPSSPKKRGRPFDRTVRAAAWEKGEEALLEESLFSRLKRERETARDHCTLQSLSSKDCQRSTAVRLDKQKRLQALNFFVAPVKGETKAAVSAEEKVKEFEVILCIEVAKPTTRQKGQHFLVLGSQMLTTLRDKIYCLTDKLMQKANSFLPSGYFRIENVFYNDMRDPDAIDYSYPILKWMHDQVLSGLRSSLNAHAADMATTQFLDLEFRVGKRYIYCHQGNCKHTVMVRDMRLIHKEDVQNIHLYPLLRVMACCSLLLSLIWIAIRSPSHSVVSAPSAPSARWFHRRACEGVLSQGRPFDYGRHYDCGLDDADSLYRLCGWAFVSIEMGYISTVSLTLHEQDKL